MEFPQSVNTHSLLESPPGVMPQEEILIHQEISLTGSHQCLLPHEHLRWQLTDSVDSPVLSPAALC